MFAPVKIRHVLPQAIQTLHDAVGKPVQKSRGCYKFGNPNDRLSNSADTESLQIRVLREPIDASPAKASPPLLEMGRGVEPLCFEHSEPWCLYCVGKPGGYA